MTEVLTKALWASLMPQLLPAEAQHCTLEEKPTQAWGGHCTCPEDAPAQLGYWLHPWLHIMCRTVPQDSVAEALALCPPAWLL